MRDKLRYISYGLYLFTLLLLKPMNYFLCRLLQWKVIDRSVLHISRLVHIPYYTTRLLRELGIHADYLAVGASGNTWTEFDYRYPPIRNPIYRAIYEFWLFWSVVCRYEVVHCHFMQGVSSSGWEWPLLKKMGRKIVVHFRGCEIRDYREIERRFPQMNICQECDYNRESCSHPNIIARREIALKYGDIFLVTTPDLLDFCPQAIHFPFFSPTIDYQHIDNFRLNDPILILHVTNHPGIEGTSHIVRVVKNLKKKGYSVELKCLAGKPHEEILSAYRAADIAIGKLKMGYYANAQIEAMFHGVPSITYVRPDLMHEDLQKSGFIFADIFNLEVVLEDYLSNPTKIIEKKKIARESILKLHNNDVLIEQLIGIYGFHA